MNAQQQAPAVDLPQAGKPLRLIRLHEVKHRTGMGRSWIYESIQRGAFPQPIPTGERAVAWVEGEIEAWIQDRIQACRAAI